jgi:hypothetical protein
VLGHPRGPEAPWRPRKERYLARIREDQDAAVLRVSLADKLDNARAVLRDLRLYGEAVWELFHAGVSRSADD